MPEVYTLQQSEKVYREYAKSLAKRSIKTGFLTIDRKIRGIMPGETVVILGRTATGKSALLQHIGLHHAEVSGEPVLFFSLEMPITSVFERALQICIGVGGSEVEDAYRTDDPEMALQANLVFTKIPNFYTVTQAGLTIETIKRIVLYCEENIFHRKTSLVLIDYLGLVREQGKDIYQQVSRVARGLKEASKELSVPIVYLSQVIKSVGEFDPLELGVARDSGAIDEAADFVLGLWREPSHGFGQFSTNDLVLGILKNRKGGTGTVTVEMDKKTLRFRERTGSGLLPGTGEPF
jgi:replicative DNA helicase